MKAALHLATLFCCLAALPGYHWHFPADDGAHPAYANEWWYFNGNLAAGDGRRFGFELTFFRVNPDLYFTHFAITDISAGTYASHERSHRGAWQQAGYTADAGGFRLWNENWQAQFDRKGPRRLDAVWGGMRLHLALDPGGRMLNGDRGYSQKGDARGQASYYYSYPHMEAGGTVDGVAVSGLAWMDHEFASDQLAPTQQGWDWMGLHLPGADLMLFNLRDTDGQRDPHSAGTILPTGGASPQALAAGDFAMTPLRWWHGYPIAWRVVVPSRHWNLVVRAALNDQEFRAPALDLSYWEGAVTVTGAAGAAPGDSAAEDEGYLEMTGYRRRFTLLQ